MSDFSAILLAAELCLAVAIIILRDPKLLIPAVIIGLPIEVIESELVARVGTTGVAGMARALANPGQLAMLAVIVVAIVRKRHDIRSLIPDSSLLVPLGAFFLLVFLSVTWSDSLRPNNSVLILPVYLGFVVTAPSLIEDRRDLERILGTFLLVAAALGVIAIAQRLFGVFNWRGILIQSDDYSYRSNATFADPNGLWNLGNNQWNLTSLSGPELVGAPASGSRGVIQSAAVEDSNVDLTKELVDMITAQRNYQANAQTIKTQDQVMQTLVNLR